ncbi:MAG TPA: hypothetical protein VJV03_01285 [Pyrinomonadaceae bacterium]|nr:hypothetical protein [Pyrinomonadaceae bacterium]
MRTAAKIEVTPDPVAQPVRVDEDFSVVLGGPLFQLFRRAYLSGTALELLHRRVIVLVTVAWLPLLFLSALEGNVWGNNVRLPFMRDIDVHARFLIAMPLLLGAELAVYHSLRNIVRQFVDRGLVPDNASTQFVAALTSAKRLRDSVLAEVLLVAFVYGVGVLVIWRKFVDVDLTSWHAPTQSAILSPSLAGWWFGLVSLPIFQFLLFRWYYRLVIWARFLWQVSRIKLNLLATHPDNHGGLGFLTVVNYAFAPLLLAQGVLLAGMIANRVLYIGTRLQDFKLDIIGLVGAAVFLVLAPLLVFSPQLVEVKLRGRREYGALAQQYIREFDNKWLRGMAPAEEQLMGSADVQSLADLGNSYDVIKEMRCVPFTGKTVLQLAVITLAPLAPLILTVVPMDLILNNLVKVIF